MTVPLVILGILAAGIVFVGLAYALRARVPPRWLALVGVAIVVIAGATLVSNPGCYATSVMLPLLPLLREGLVETEGIVADAKSGGTGALKESEVAPEIRKGGSFPLGATPCPEGVNFSVFSRGATGMELLFFDREEDSRPARVIPIDPDIQPHVPLLARVRAGRAGKPDLRLAR